MKVKLYAVIAVVLAAALLSGCVIPDYLGIFPGSSRGNPAPANTAVVVNSGETTISITLLEVTRGAQAYQQVNASARNDLPDMPGKEYLNARFKIEINGLPASVSSFDIDRNQFTLVSERGEVYERINVNAAPAIFKEVMKGGNTDGWVSFAVDSGDNPTIEFTFHGSGGEKSAWFKMA